MSYNPPRGYRVFVPPPTALPSPTTPSSWAERVRSTMRSTIGLAAPESDVRPWSFPRLGAMRRAPHDWEQRFPPTTPDAVGDVDTAEQVYESLHPGVRLRTLPPYPPQSVYELVPTSERTVFILGRRRSKPDLNRSKSDGSSDGSEAETEVVNMHSRVVSKRHARVEFIAQEVYITDLDSTHGTWVLREGSTDQFLGNDVPFALKDGDEIRIGRRVHGYPAVHLIVETIGTLATSGGTKAPVTPDMSGRMPLSPPPSRRRSTNSFRAPDFSDMDISRSPSPSSTSARLPSLGAALQSPIILDHTPSPAISEHNSPMQSASNLPLPVSDMQEELNRWAAYTSSPAHSDELDEPELVAIPSREPRPYEFIMTPSVLGTFTVDEARLPSPPVVPDEVVGLVATDMLAVDALPPSSSQVSQPESFAELHAAGYPSQSASFLYQAPMEGEHIAQPAAAILVHETTSVAEGLSTIQDSNLGSAEPLAEPPREVPVTETTSEDSLSSEVPGSISESHFDATVDRDRLDVRRAVGASNQEFAIAGSAADNLDGSARVDAAPSGSDQDDPVGALDAEDATAGNASTNLDEQLQRLDTMLTEIRAMGTVDNTDCDEKWSNVNHLLMELRKGKDLSDGKLMILQHGFYTGTSEGCDGTVPSRKRKRGHTDEDHDSDRSGEVEPARRHLVNPSSRDKETPAGQDLEPRPTKRRRSLATSSTSLAFVAGGAAVWLALGMDYGL